MSMPTRASNVSTVNKSINSDPVLILYREGKFGDLQ